MFNPPLSPKFVLDIDENPVIQNLLNMENLQLKSIETYLTINYLRLKNSGSEQYEDEDEATSPTRNR